MGFVLCAGEALVDFVAHTRSADVGASELFRRAAGGAVANVAVGIARLGGQAHFCGTLGRDGFGRFLLRTLAHENVAVDGVRMVDERTTLAFVARGEHGARDFFFVREPGADSRLSPADIPAHELHGAGVFHFGGVLLSSEPARSTCLAAAAQARAFGALVSFDVNARETLFASRDQMRELLLAGCAQAQLVKLSEEDLDAIGVAPADAQSLLNDVTRALVVTRGERGACWLFADAQGRSEPARARGEIGSPAIEAVDTTGAGDAATAAIVWRLEGAYQARLSAGALADAARHGCAAGAFACLREGAIPSLPTASELQTMLSRVPAST